MSSLAGLVGQSIEQGDGRLEHALLRSEDPRLIAELLESFVATTLTEPIDALFYRAGVGIVVGFRLSDDSSVVLKLHRWNVSTERLGSIQSVQGYLASEGLPVPRPLSPPIRLGEGIAVIEEYRPGLRPNARDANVRTSIAEGLYNFIDAARALTGIGDVGTPLLLHSTGAHLWHEPHDLRFDFDATTEGADWIDKAARNAKSRLHPATGVPVIGHFDWRVENLGFDGHTITAIYDWDSVGRAPEPIIVGMSAAQFCSDWTAAEAIDPLPTVEEMLGFVRDYEAIRGSKFSKKECEQLDAANLWNVAYGARCQHSDNILRPDLAPAADTRWSRLLRDRGDHLFDDSKRGAP